jgi:DNA processing protein
LTAAGVPPDAQAGLASGRYRCMAQEIADWAAHEECQIVLQGDPEYPRLLKEIYDPPLLLYALGQLEALSSPTIAIVGTRRPTVYGLQMAEGLASDLAQRGMTVISGLARGIDASAHRGCLQAKGRTVAILGCGIDIVYPSEHRQLARRIRECGLLLTEFPPGTPPSPQNFPVRNRIISGLSLGTVVVEASEYSGSLITARLAMEQNREIFAVPGNITSPQSFGPNFLIKQGAKLVQCWRDVAEEMIPEIRQKLLRAEETKSLDPPQLDILTSQETIILSLLSTDKATQFDWLVQKSRLAVPFLCDALLQLEMKGLIRQIPGSLYIKVAARQQNKMG